MEREKIEDAISAKLIEKDGKNYLSCGIALKIAEDLKVSAAEIGRICNDLNIKIKSCQLGCF